MLSPNVVPVEELMDPFGIVGGDPQDTAARVCMCNS